MGVMPPSEALEAIPLFATLTPIPPPLLPLPTSAAAPPAGSMTLSQGHLAGNQPVVRSASGAATGSRDQAQSAMPGGSFLGDAQCPLPDALRKRILKLEFIDMAELCPEAWLFEDSATESSVASFFKWRKEPVTDILLWVQCYCSLVSILGESYPQYMQHFLSYLAQTVRNYKSRALEWVAYDVAYRRKAAYLKRLDWAVIDHNLSATWFTGHGNVLSCMHCLGEDHSAAACP